MSTLETHPALSPGTQVVLCRAGLGDAPGRRAGEVGAIAAIAGPGRYRVRFPDGGEATVARADLIIRKHHQRAGLIGEGGPAAGDLRPYIVYRCVVGSRAYGLAGDGSDTDRRGFYLPPADLHWGLAGVPEIVEWPAAEAAYWEIQKFLTLALKANPNVLECLYTPLVEHAAPIAEDLIAGRSAFLSRLVYQTYHGYVLSQFKRLEADLRVSGAIKWKHVMHLIRLLLSGITVLREGFVPVDVGDYRDHLLAIRRGELPWPEVDAWRLSLHREFDAARAATRLPDRPDYAWANDYLIRARRSMVTASAAGGER